MMGLNEVQQTTDQAAQVATAALQAPLNNLVVIVAILALIIVGSVIFVIWKFVPIILKQVQQLIDNNSKLTNIAAQNADQAKLSELALEKNTSELVRQTNAIENTNIEIKSQSLDFRNYQTLVSDGLNNHTNQIEANTAIIAKFEATMVALPEQIRVMIDDRMKCEGLEQLIRALRTEVVQALSQQTLTKRTGTQPVVPISPTTNGEAT